MAKRQKTIQKFLEINGWSNAERIKLGGDASFRTYYRLKDKGRGAILMDAPPDLEQVDPFLKIARHLKSLGYSAPSIFAANRGLGLVLLEDFGENTFTSLLAAGENEKKLYLLATDFLIDLHSRPLNQTVPNNLEQYTLNKFIAEVSLLTDWFVPAFNNWGLSEESKLEYESKWRQLIGLDLGVPQNLVLRDYHVDNLMRLEDRVGIAACGLLDFQDAVVGPVTYDLISLIEDARRDVSIETAESVKKKYLSAFPNICPNQFRRSMAVLGAQRHAKVIGIFTRLCVRDKKMVYLEHIPRVWRLFENACNHPELSIMKTWIDENIPAKYRRIPEGLAASC